ncbi:hypothetical protein IFM89_034439, partial [Coptis chinensis]
SWKAMPADITLWQEQRSISNLRGLKIVAKSRQQLASPTSPRSREWDRPTRWFEYLTSKINLPVMSSSWKPISPEKVCLAKMYRLNQILVMLTLFHMCARNSFESGCRSKSSENLSAGFKNFLLEVPELDGKTHKMYKGGKICLTVHFKPLWAKNRYVECPFF